MHLLKQSLTRKDFYAKKYKQVSRTRTIVFVLVISIVFALFTSPINSLNSYRTFITLKEKVNELPPKVEIGYTSNDGLSTNVNYPIKLEMDENNLIVIDPKALYSSSENTLNEIILRQRGYLIYKNGELASQITYGMPDFLEFNVTSQKLKEEFNSVSSAYLLTVLSIVNLFMSFFSALINVFVMSVMFGSVSYVVNTTLLKRKDTLLQNYKKMLFLSTFLLLGMAVNTMFTGQGFIFDILFLGFGYLWLVR